MHINAFSISWQGRPFHVFPPFAVIGKVLHKIVLAVATGIIVVPNWPTQSRYSLLMNLLVHIPILLSSSETLLQHPSKSKPYPLANKLGATNQGATNLSAESTRIIQQSRHPSTTKIWQLHWEMESVLSRKGYWSHFYIFRPVHWIPNQNFWIQCWVLISRLSKISPIICSHYGQWKILWETSPCSVFYERYI